MSVTAGATFYIVPTWVEPIEPVFNVISTPSESMKKEYFSMGSTSIDQYKLIFSGVSDAGYNGGGGIYNHFIGQNGGFQAFKWSSVPSYINGGAAVTGRWVPGSFEAKPNSNDWDVEITFEKSN